MNITDDKINRPTSGFDKLKKHLQKLLPHEFFDVNYPDRKQFIAAECLAYSLKALGVVLGASVPIGLIMSSQAMGNTIAYGIHYP